MVKPELGSKRQCLSCGAKFFDLNRDPILCPKCGAVFQVALNARSPRAAAEEEEEAAPDSGPELVALEEADGDSDKAIVTEDDIEIEDDGSEDDTFLAEEEEDDEDVADFIDGDIEVDEES